ncbi:hypothetical protein BWQ96_04071 [Gracilariopsis chorda]|uniref:Uncharacterized protein n=1 Tax=Gracilariopsis chorda TaxID=448386 RepID=A0A2V3IVN4_9FLOR|nr:hypothetical protein BWQ96_04071 [Gracilariopsis chorda]|eukprot:PXF46194.1 hypothetical protein BWQ96_04071 [Gracilariopsis chorda]
MTQMVVPVTCQEHGLILVQNGSKLVKKHVTLIANSIRDNIPNQPFSVYVSNSGDKPAKLPKNTVIGHSYPAPENIFALVRSTEVGHPREGGGDTKIAKPNPAERHGPLRRPFGESCNEDDQEGEVEEKGEDEDH